MVRQNLVDQGIRFFKHPKVQDTSLSERLQFLEKKGLTADEIAAVLKVVEKKSDNTTKSSTEGAIVTNTAIESATTFLSGERLKDRIVVIFGGDSILGNVISLRCAKEDAIVVLVGHEDSKLNKTLQIIEKQTADGTPSCSKYLTVSRNCDWERYLTILKEVSSQFNRIDVVINCFQPPQNSSLLNTTESNYNEVQQFIAQFVGANKATVQQFLTQVPSTVSGLRGRIINVSSVCGVEQVSQCYTYGLHSSAIIQISKQTANDFANDGIACNVISTTSITDIQSEHNYLPITGSFWRQCYTSDVANMVIFLSSEDTRSMHGGNLILGDKSSP